MEIKAKSVLQHELQLGEVANNVWTYSPSAAITRERVLESDLWVLNAKRFRRYDRIFVIAEAAGFFAELLVRDCSEFHVQISPLRFVDLDAVADVDPDLCPSGHSVKWLGPVEGWAAFRGEQRLRADFANKNDALAYLIDLGLAGCR